MFERAIAADPNFAPAYAMLSKTLLGDRHGILGGPEEHKVPEQARSKPWLPGNAPLRWIPMTQEDHAAVGGALYDAKGSF